MSSYFDCDGDANYFLHQSHEEEEHAEKLMKLQSQQGGRISLQDIKKPDHDDWEEWAECNGVGITLGEKSLLQLHKLVTDKNDPQMCDFIETYYLEQVRPIKELGDHITNLCGLEAPEIGMAEYLFDKAHPGRQ